MTEKRNMSIINTRELEENEAETVAHLTMGLRTWSCYRLRSIVEKQLAELKLKHPNTRIAGRGHRLNFKTLENASTAIMR
jgi:hypothetical protein